MIRCCDPVKKKKIKFFIQKNVGILKSIQYFNTHIFSMTIILPFLKRNNDNYSLGNLQYKELDTILSHESTKSSWYIGKSYIRTLRKVQIHFCQSLVQCIQMSYVKVLCLHFLVCQMKTIIKLIHRFIARNKLMQVEYLQQCLSSSKPLNRSQLLLVGTQP